MGVVLVVLLPLICGITTVAGLSLAWTFGLCGRVRLALLAGMNFVALLFAIPVLADWTLATQSHQYSRQPVVFPAVSTPDAGRNFQCRSDDIGTTIIFSIDEVGFRQWAKDCGCEIEQPGYYGDKAPETATIAFRKRLSETGRGFDARYYASLKQAIFRYSSK